MVNLCLYLWNSLRLSTVWLFPDCLQFLLVSTTGFINRWENCNNTRLLQFSWITAVLLRNHRDTIYCALDKTYNMYSVRHLRHTFFILARTLKTNSYWPSSHVTLLGVACKLLSAATWVTCKREPESCVVGVRTRDTWCYVTHCCTHSVLIVAHIVCSLLLRVPLVFYSDYSLFLWSSSILNVRKYVLFVPIHVMNEQRCFEC